MHWFLLASGICQREWLAFFPSEQASPADAQGRNLATQRALQTSSSRGTGKGQKRQTSCLTLGCLRSATLPAGRVDSTYSSISPWGWCCSAPVSHRIFDLTTGELPIITQPTFLHFKHESSLQETGAAWLPLVTGNSLLTKTHISLLLSIYCIFFLLLFKISLQEYDPHLPSLESKNVSQITAP